MTGSTKHEGVHAAAEAAARDAGETVAREGKRIADAAKAEARAFADDRKAMTRTYLNDVSVAMQEGSRRLEDGGHHTSARMVDHVASEVRDAAREIEGRTPLELLQELERLAHRRPAMFFGAALLAGFGAARFLRSGQDLSNTGTSRPPEPHK
jgi:hypothetical protein